MKFKPKILLAAVFCVLVASILRLSVIKAQTAPSPKQENATLADPKPLIPPGSDPLLLLQSSSTDQRDDAGIYLLRHQEDTEDKVQAIAEAFLAQAATSRARKPHELNNQEAKRAAFGARNAVGLLGAFRSTRAIPFLVSHLSDGYVFIEHPVGLGGAYPCAGALVSIGSPALDPLLVNVAQTDNAQTIRLTAYAFVEVLGSNIAAAFTEDRRSKLTAPAAKHRLDILEHIIRTEKFPF